MAAPSDWHALSAAETLATLETSTDGLDDAALCQRRAHHGSNTLPQARPQTLLQRFFRQFHNLLIYILLAASGVTAWLGDMLDTGVILGVVLINAVIGALQEGRAESALSAIRTLLAPRALVRRGGQRQEVEAASLVPGDIVLLQSGDKVPADLRLVEVRALRVDESALTGESVPVEKSEAPCRADTPLAERHNMAYAGTVVSYGQAEGVVVATGRETELGRITTLLAGVESRETPLTRLLDRFARWLTGVILAVTVLTLLLGVYWRGESWEAMFLAGVGLAVAAVPEGLPAIVTITLAIGVERMARRRAIMRKLPAVETLGAVSVICTDKTGTLTRNEMMVAEIMLADAALVAEGNGYAPEGRLLREAQPLEAGTLPTLAPLLRAAALCNDARLYVRDGQWQVEGDPTEGALLTLAHKAGLPPETLLARLPRLDTLPFESERRFMATLHHDHQGHRVAYLKGAPEVILARAVSALSGQGPIPLEVGFWQERVNALAARGLRVLALAAVPDVVEAELDESLLEGGLTLLGLVGLIDPPREEAREAVRACQSAGIRVKMITGDHAATAVAIGSALGIGDGRRVLTGAQLEVLDDTTLAEAIRDTDVFARTSPEHKLRLVKALQAEGRVIAMTGDGVNDAPALKRADVGVAMGAKGTDAAREAADMVLTDDNFASIVRAVEEGRTVYDNLKKTILFILPTNAGEAAIIVAAILAGVPLPITPLQILWINMVTAVTLALALAFEPPEGDVMQRPPRPPEARLMDGLFVWRLVFVGALMVALPFALYLWAEANGSTVAQARTLAVNAMVATEIGYLFNSRALLAAPWPRGGRRPNPAVAWAVGVLLLLQAALTGLPMMQRLFGTAPLSAGEWLAVAGCGGVTFLLVEAEKALRRRAGQKVAPARAR
ncbi:cation-translocating P-type ATPase [Gulbenkiania mobilis]|uniref:P-type E1-E2 ATPase n=1 Tax=Gulbenkiania mobilis TaxID=397457 RepID=A0ABY2D196_GULMO|nr:P-type E1-E2 ATPase [Gulbenkiania mobilis]